MPVTVDDHAINSLETWFDLAYKELKKEWNSGHFENLSDCPSFQATKAYRLAITVLKKAYYGSELVGKLKFESLEEKIDEELETED